MPAWHALIAKGQKSAQYRDCLHMKKVSRPQFFVINYDLTFSLVMENMTWTK
jgi:hypothetical protein